MVVVVMLVVVCVSDPGGTSCCHSVTDCTSHLSGHWCRSCQYRSCRSPLCIVWPCVLVVHICSRHLLLAFLLSFSSLLVAVVSFSFSFVVVSFSFGISLLSFERMSLSNRLLIVLTFSSFIVVVAEVVAVAAVAFAFVVFSFAFVLALLPFSFVVPCCSYVHWRRSLIVVAA